MSDSLDEYCKKWGITREQFDEWREEAHREWAESLDVDDMHERLVSLAQGTELFDYGPRHGHLWQYSPAIRRFFYPDRRGVSALVAMGYLLEQPIIFQDDNSPGAKFELTEKGRCYVEMFGDSAEPFSVYIRKDGKARYLVRGGTGLDFKRLTGAEGVTLDDFTIEPVSEDFREVHQRLLGVDVPPRPD